MQTFNPLVKKGFDNTGSSSYNYSSVAYVDMNANANTGVLGDISKPFRNIDEIPLNEAGSTVLVFLLSNVECNTPVIPQDYQKLIYNLNGFKITIQSNTYAVKATLCDFTGSTDVELSVFNGIIDCIYSGDSSSAGYIFIGSAAGGGRVNLFNILGNGDITLVEHGENIISVIDSCKLDSSSFALSLGSQSYISSNIKILNSTIFGIISVEIPFTIKDTSINGSITILKGGSLRNVKIRSTSFNAVSILYNYGNIDKLYFDDVEVSKLQSTNSVAFYIQSTDNLTIGIS